MFPDMDLLLKRGLALMLPVCMVWLFAACVAMCAMHVETRSLTKSFGHSDSIVALDTECCSVIDGQRSLLPERVTSTIVLLRATQSGGNSTVPSVALFSKLTRPACFSFHSPPLDLLGTLRI